MTGAGHYLKKASEDNLVSHISYSDCRLKKADADDQKRLVFWFVICGFENEEFKYDHWIALGTKNNIQHFDTELKKKGL